MLGYKKIELKSRVGSALNLPLNGNEYSLNSIEIYSRIQKLMNTNMKGIN